MRTIKFRGKRVDNGEWIIGNIFIPDVLVKGIYICPRSSYANFYPDFEDGDDINDHKSSGCSLGHFHEVIPETVGQFTGLLDKNNIEIYEWDVVGYMKTVHMSSCSYKEHTSFTVKFENDGAIGFRTGFNINCGNHDEIEVISNIHEQ